ncbi:hypothetical protein [Longimicrobium terrae]|uniref:Uncharacterized protein n=1 Tax=Longimicrobium terrae TaxID=1639882 RepID=A0A841H081_9BACT|nr:hypothetical protein [Longimicrobium terrae]MBB4636962.1 hypothetical protein [Longimicrobium terrae]MBB6071430.1 hypothetical protein [Longimicrobium terrae]NNC31349.1 hypothetical protein [Longimicrobium terrae]
MFNADLTFAGLTLGLSATEDVLGAIRSEVEPFFRVGPNQAPSRVNLWLGSEGSAALAARCEGPGEPLAVDTSLYAHLASTGTRWGSPGADRWVVRVDATNTYAAFDRPAARIDLVQPDPELLVRDGVRLIKGLLTPGLEAEGAIQVHASGVTTPEGGVLLLGEMWHGKTTLLLDLLSEFDTRQLSCDTVVLRVEEDGCVSAHGWPSPFSVSHGTLADHPRLHFAIPPERRRLPYDTLWREGRKSVLRSSDVVARLGTTLEPSATRLAACVIARFAPGEETRLRRVQSVDELVGFLPRVYLGSRDPIYHNWHGYFTCDDDAIDRNMERVGAALFGQTPVYELVWAPSAVSLLKRVPELERAHRTLGPLLHARPPEEAPAGERNVR